MGKPALILARRALVCLIALTICSCLYMKALPTPDVDKAFLPLNNSCWLATAANMLAGAGYGTGTSMQARADDIYGDLTSHFGTANRGWPDTAATWWLSSTNNTWTTNPYTLLTVLGTKMMNPWANANVPGTIADELRRCQLIGLALSWPTNQVDQFGNDIVGTGGHAITAWGDNRCPNAVSPNPTQIRVADSDTDVGGDVQVYAWDSFTNPNPGGPNEANGWYFNYSANHPYLRCAITLCPAANTSGNPTTQRVVGSYRIHQLADAQATDLHYTVGSDVDVLSYRTSIDWGPVLTPSITESSPQRRSITVDWDLSKYPVPKCTWVTVTTEFILPYWNAMQYSDVRFTYPVAIQFRVPAIAWRIDSPELKSAELIPNSTGGYVVAAFDIIEPNLPKDIAKIGEYRLLHQYSYNQSPEFHSFQISGGDGFRIANFRFGHSYGLLDERAMWGFKDWMTVMKDVSIDLSKEPQSLDIDWKGRLPYPDIGEFRKGILDPVAALKKTTVE